MTRETYADDAIARLLRATRTIAIIGASPDPDRHSHRVLKYMKQNGFRVIPVNPRAIGQEICGEPVVGRLADAPAPVELVDVFRRPEFIPDVVDEVLAVHASKGIRFLWLQLDLYDEGSARRARDAGIEVVMDRCIKIEYGRLLSHRA